MNEEEINIWLEFMNKFVDFIDKAPVEVDKGTEHVQKLWMADQLHLEGFRIYKVTDAVEVKEEV